MEANNKIDMSYALFKKSDSYTFNLFRGPVWHVGTPFKVIEVNIPLGQPVTGDIELVPVLRFDHDQDSAVGTAINTANYTEEKQYIHMRADNFNDHTQGDNNFYLELQFTGGDLCTVSLPITVRVELDETGQIETFTIGSIFDGIMQTSMFGGASQYLAGIGIDPDVPLSDDAGDVKTAGLIRPVNYVKFSGEAVDSAPIAIITTPKDAYVYVVLSSGSLVRYDSDLSNETVLGHVQESSSDVEARGADYYNNYIYIRTPHDVSRWGPLDGSPSMTDEFWTSDLSKTALTDSDYPLTLFDVGYLNHYGTVHVDAALYFLDYADGIGMVHFIKTEKGSAQGDTDNSVRPSAFNFLDLPDDFIPITISSYGNDLVVGGAFTTDATIHQGRAAIFFFNPADTTPSYYRVVYLPDTICSVLKYDNGILYGISGDLAGGYRLWRYVGGDSVETLEMVEDGVPPLQGAADYVASRLVWAANTTYPMVSSGLYAYGSKSDLFKGLHNIAVSGFN